ncbi:MAG TPA: hypothetical protein VKA34_23505 [Balneolales bacterium]|nr:hypothetical protein [Balneolales bacterium]
MNFKESPYYSDFDSLLVQINREFKKLRQKIMTLQEENAILKKELSRLKNAHQSGLDDRSESERIALRHQINGLISKIDHYLDDSNV